jgi:ribonuclease HI
LTKDRKIEAAEWKRMRFKKNKVWLATEAGGRPIEKDDKVLIKYQLEQDYEYWVKKESVRSLDSALPQDRPQKSAQPRKKQPAKNIDRTRIKDSSTTAGDTICIFTDGASSGNPGPSGIGVLLRFGAHEKEISQFIGEATNNIAELKAIEAGLLAVKNTDLPVKVYTDSNYAYGVLTLGWKSKKNKDLVESIKKIISKFKNLTFIKVKGHAGHEGNERADSLATTAIKKAGT